MDIEQATLTTYEDLAKRIDHSLLRPELTEEEVVAGCRLAGAYGVASVTVRPCDVDLAVSLLAGTDVRVGSVAGFPFGVQNTPTKLYEARDLLRRGAREIGVVMNTGKLISRQFPYLEAELTQMAQACRENGAVLKVIFDNPHLTPDLKIVACKLCKRTGADFAATSATPEDLRLVVKHCSPRVQVKAAGEVKSLGQAREVSEIGCQRLDSTATAVILDEWKRLLDSATADQGKSA